MKTFARIQDHLVAEILKTDADIRTLFHPTLIWIDVSSVQGIREGWTYDGHSFAPPPVASPTATSPTLAELQARVDQLRAEIAALSKSA